MNNRSVKRNVIVPNLKIDVTSADIINACRNNPNKCMIADAIQRKYPWARWVFVDTRSIRISDPGKGYRYFYFTPDSAGRALFAFDQGQDVKPFSFHLGAMGVATRLGELVKKGTIRPMVRVGGGFIGKRPAGWRDPRPRSGEARVKRALPKFTKIRKFGACLLHESPV